MRTVKECVKGCVKGDNEDVKENMCVKSVS